MTALLVVAFWLCAVAACVLWVQLGHDPTPRRRRCGKAGLLVVLGVLTQAQVCAKHVRLHGVYNTHARSMVLDTFSGFADVVCPTAASHETLVFSWEDGAIPEWLNGSPTSAAAPVHLTVQSLVFGGPFALTESFTATRFQDRDEYAFAGLVGSEAFYSDPSGGYTIVIGSPGCFTEWRNVKVDDQSTFHGCNGHSCTQPETFAPVNSQDTVRPCEWQDAGYNLYPGCQTVTQVQDCDEDGCLFECPDNAPYFDDITDRCCTCANR